MLHARVKGRRGVRGCDRDCNSVNRAFTSRCFCPVRETVKGFAVCVRKRQKLFLSLFRVLPKKLSLSTILRMQYSKIQKSYYFLMTKSNSWNVIFFNKKSYLFWLRHWRCFIELQVKSGAIETIIGLQGIVYLSFWFLYCWGISFREHWPAGLINAV